MLEHHAELHSAEPLRTQNAGGDIPAVNGIDGKRQSFFRNGWKRRREVLFADIPYLQGHRYAVGNYFEDSPAELINRDVVSNDLSVS